MPLFESMNVPVADVKIDESITDAQSNFIAKLSVNRYQ